MYIASLVNLLHGLDFDKKCEGEKLPARRLAQAQEEGNWSLGGGMLASRGRPTEAANMAASRGSQELWEGHQRGWSYEEPEVNQGPGDTRFININKAEVSEVLEFLKKMLSCS